MVLIVRLLIVPALDSLRISLHLAQEFLKNHLAHLRIEAWKMLKSMDGTLCLKPQWSIPDPISMGKILAINRVEKCRKSLGGIYESQMCWPDMEVISWFF